MNLIEQIVRRLLEATLLPFWLKPLGGKKMRVLSFRFGKAHEDYLWDREKGNFPKATYSGEAFEQAFKAGWIRGYVEKRGRDTDLSFFTARKLSRQEAIDLALDVATDYGFNVRNVDQIVVGWDDGGGGQTLYSDLWK